MSSSETYLEAFTYQAVMAPCVAAVDGPTSVTNALQKVDQHLPGFLLDLVKTLHPGTSVQESFLRLQATASVDDLKVHHSDNVLFTTLTDRAIMLRRVLARVPDEMKDRRKFLETIKEIASSIKKLLDACNAVCAAVPPSIQPSVERRKKEFVHYSKRFSNTLKEYFKGQAAEGVFVSANQLVYYTALILRVVNDKTKSLNM